THLRAMALLDQPAFLQLTQLLRHSIGGAIAHHDNLVRRAALLEQRLNAPLDRVFLIVPGDQDSHAVGVGVGDVTTFRIPTEAKSGDRYKAQGVARNLEYGDDQEQTQQTFAALRQQISDSV